MKNGNFRQTECCIALCGIMFSSFDTDTAEFTLISSFRFAIVMISSEITRISADATVQLVQLMANMAQ